MDTTRDIVALRAIVSVAFLVAVVACGALFAANALHAELPWVNHDVVYHTYLGYEMHQGARLYVDLKEDNPPGSPLLLGALAMAGHHLGVPDFLMPLLFVLVVVLAGLGLLARTFPGPEERWTFALCAATYLLVVVRGNFANNLFAGAFALPYD